MAKTKLNENIIDKAHKLIAAGNYAIIVCQYLGIDESTYYRWKDRGEKDIISNKNTIFSKFCKSIKEAEAKAELRNVTIIQKAGEKNWQAAAWYLERKHKDRWAQKQEHDIKGNLGVQIVDDIK